MFRCRVCKKRKRDENRCAGKDRICKPCRAKQAAKYRAKHPERARAANRKWATKARRRYPEKMLWFGARGRAGTKGIKFSIKVEDIRIPNKCPVFGFPIRMRKGRCYDNPSIDRLVPAKGYVKGNISVISHLANQVKNSGTSLQHMIVARWIEREFKKRGWRERATLTPQRARTR